MGGAIQGSDLNFFLFYLFIFYKITLTNIQNKKLINIIQRQINERKNTCSMYCKIKLIHKNIKKQNDINYLSENKFLV